MKNEHYKNNNCGFLGLILETVSWGKPDGLITGLEPVFLIIYDVAEDNTLLSDLVDVNDCSWVKI